MNASRAALVALLATLSVPAPALACGGAIVMRHFQAPKKADPPMPVLVADAEKKLEEGDHKAAVSAAKRAYPKVKTGSPSSGLESRALRVAALAVTRSEGAVGPEGTKTSAPKARESNLAWSAMVLKGLDAKAEVERGGDPAIKANLGEALARVDATRDEGFRVLKDLSDRDLMGSPQAYATLARLAKERGDEALERTARGRCETMSGGKAVCGEAPAAAPETVRASFAPPQKSKVAHVTRPLDVRF
ncbi:MAG TPA: hypothetical protein VFS43_29170 [Polyangiaceae bacterium]|nr:hypothetical protein [Polyangiaceae bacterium]